MDVVLSSFCFNDSGHLQGWYRGTPPVSFRSLGASFCPDYAAILLGDRFYVDSLTVERVEQMPAFAEHQELFVALRNAGRLETVDYAAIVEPYAEVIKRSVSADLKDMAKWRKPYMELVTRWCELRDFARGIEFSRADRASGLGRDDSVKEVLLGIAYLGDMLPGMLDERVLIALKNWRRSVSHYHRMQTRRVLAAYLGHVASMLCLADCLGAVIHDWSDIEPLYTHKLSETPVGKSNRREVARQATCRKLMELVMPDFHPETPTALARILDDPRIEQLRRLVDNAVLRDVELDERYANELLRSALSQENRLQSYRKLVGWLSMPLSFVPWAGTALEKAAQITAERVIENRVRGDNAWFFLLSSVNNPVDIKIKSTQNNRT